MAASALNEVDDWLISQIQEEEPAFSECPIANSQLGMKPQQPDFYEDTYYDYLDDDEMLLYEPRRRPPFSASGEKPKFQNKFIRRPWQKPMPLSVKRKKFSLSHEILDRYRPRLFTIRGRIVSSDVMTNSSRMKTVSRGYLHRWETKAVMLSEHREPEAEDYLGMVVAFKYCMVFYKAPPDLVQSKPAAMERLASMGISLASYAAAFETFDPRLYRQTNSRLMRDIHEADPYKSHSEFEDEHPLYVDPRHGRPPELETHQEYTTFSLRDGIPVTYRITDLDEERCRELGRDTVIRKVFGPRIFSCRGRIVTSAFLRTNTRAKYLEGGRVSLEEARSLIREHHREPDDEDFLGFAKTYGAAVVFYKAPPTIIETKPKAIDRLLDMGISLAAYTATFEIDTSEYLQKYCSFALWKTVVKNDPYRDEFDDAEYFISGSEDYSDSEMVEGRRRAPSAWTRPKSRSRGGRSFNDSRKSQTPRRRRRPSYEGEEDERSIEDEEKYTATLVTEEDLTGMPTIHSRRARPVKPSKRVAAVEIMAAARAAVKTRRSSRGGRARGRGRGRGAGVGMAKENRLLPKTDDGALSTYCPEVSSDKVAALKQTISNEDLEVYSSGMFRELRGSYVTMRMLTDRYPECVANTAKKVILLNTRNEEEPDYLGKILFVSGIQAPIFYKAPPRIVKERPEALERLESLGTSFDEYCEVYAADGTEEYKQKGSAWSSACNSLRSLDPHLRPEPKKAPTPPKKETISAKKETISPKKEPIVFEELPPEPVSTPKQTASRTVVPPRRYSPSREVESRRSQATTSEDLTTGDSGAVKDFHRIESKLRGLKRKHLMQRQNDGAKRGKRGSKSVKSVPLSASEITDPILSKDPEDAVLLESLDAADEVSVLEPESQMVWCSHTNQFTSSAEAAKNAKLALMSAEVPRRSTTGRGQSRRGGGPGRGRMGRPAKAKPGKSVASLGSVPADNPFLEAEADD